MLLSKNFWQWLFSTKGLSLVTKAVICRISALAAEGPGGAVNPLANLGQSPVNFSILCIKGLHRCDLTGLKGTILHTVISFNLEVLSILSHHCQLSNKTNEIKITPLKDFGTFKGANH